MGRTGCVLRFTRGAGSGVWMLQLSGRQAGRGKRREGGGACFCMRAWAWVRSCKRQRESTPWGRNRICLLTCPVSLFLLSFSLSLSSFFSLFSFISFPPSHSCHPSLHSFRFPSRSLFLLHQSNHDDTPPHSPPLDTFVSLSLSLSLVFAFFVLSKHLHLFHSLFTSTPHFTLDASIVSPHSLFSTSRFLYALLPLPSLLFPASLFRWPQPRRT